MEVFILLEEENTLNIEKKEHLGQSTPYVLDESEDYKTIDYISRKSINNIHQALRGLTGEKPEIFVIRFKILHAMSTKASKPFLKLEDIHHITNIPINVISNHLQPLKDSNLLNNKGGQYWRVTSEGRRLLDTLTILLFEFSGDFDDIDLINASLRHLNVFANFYGLDLKINSRIVRHFDYIVSEIEAQPIELLDPNQTQKLRQLLKKVDSFYNHLRIQLYQSNKVEPKDTWLILDRLAQRHNIVSNIMLKLNYHITKLGSNIDIQEALSHFLDKINPKNALKDYGNYFRFSPINISSQISNKNLLEHVKGVLFYKPSRKLPNYKALPFQLISKKLEVKEIEKDM